MAWQQNQPQPEDHHQRASKPAAPPSPSPSTSTSSAVVEEAPVQEPWRSHNIFIESQDALVAAQRRFLLSVVRATRAHLDGLVDQEEVALFGHFYPDARARLNQGFSGQNHLRLDEWDRSLERARQQFGLELKAMAQRMQYLHVDAMRELIGDDDDWIETVAVPLASSSTSLPTPATSPEPSRKRGLDDTDENANDKTDTGRPRPLKRARLGAAVKSEDRDLDVSLVSSSSGEAALSSSLKASSPSSSSIAPVTRSSPRASRTSAVPLRRSRRLRSRSGIRKTS
jgi:hypothetical protein